MYPPEKHAPGKEWPLMVNPMVRHSLATDDQGVERTERLIFPCFFDSSVFTSPFSIIDTRLRQKGTRQKIAAGARHGLVGNKGKKWAGKRWEVFRAV